MLSGCATSQTLELQTLEEAQDDMVPVLDYRPPRYLGRPLEDQGRDVCEVPVNSISARGLTSSQS